MIIMWYAVAQMFSLCPTQAKKPIIQFQFEVIGIFHLRNHSAPYWPWFDSASKRKEHQEYLMGSKGGWGIRLKTLQLSCADFLYIL